MQRTDVLRLALVATLGVAAATPATWPVLFDGLGAAGAVARRFQVEYPPRSLLFDREGLLVALDPRGEMLDAALRVLFAAE